MVDFNILKNVPDVSNIDYSKLISYSQFTLWSECPQKWKLQYIDKIKQPPNIYLVFGSAVHDVVQKYLFEREHGSLNGFDVETLLKDRMKHHYLDQLKKVDGEHFSNPNELLIFLNQGTRTITWFIDNIGDFIEDGETLLAIESPVLVKPHDKYDVTFKGYLDLVTKKPDGTISIKDIKTSTKGWGSFAKKDFKKTAQLMLYKKYLSEQLNIDLSRIDVQYIIMKREVPEPFEVEFPAMLNRVQKFTPSNGKINVNKADKSVKEFIEYCFNEDGTKRDRVYEATRGNYIEPMSEYSSCAFCPFKDSFDLCPEEDRI